VRRETGTVTEPCGDPIRVAIVEDQRTIREGLALLIDGAVGFRCTGPFASMKDALPKVVADPPSVLLIDLGLPGMSGVEGIRKLHERLPGLPVLVLAVYDDDDRILEAVLAGARGYALKKTPPDVLLACLRSVSAGEAPMSPELARQVLGLWSNGKTASGLSPDEVRILEKLAEGHVYQTAAVELTLPAREIGFRMKRVYDRIHLQFAEKHSLT
jgi:DNA-binding NarL/FixJ family response regulator